LCRLSRGWSDPGLPTKAKPASVNTIDGYAAELSLSVMALPREPKVFTEEDYLRINRA